MEPGQDDDNRFRAQVREITFLGNRCRVSFELDALPGHPLLAELDPAQMPRLGGPDIWRCRPAACRCSPDGAHPGPAAECPPSPGRPGDRLFIQGGKCLFLAFLAVAVVLPLAAIFSGEAGQGGGLVAARELLASANFHWLLGNSLVSLSVAALVVPVAYLFAYAPTRTLIPARGCGAASPCCRCWRPRCCRGSR